MSAPHDYVCVCVCVSLCGLVCVRVDWCVCASVLLCSNAKYIFLHAATHSHGGDCHANPLAGQETEKNRPCPTQSTFPTACGAPFTGEGPILSLIHSHTYTQGCSSRPPSTSTQFDIACLAGVCDLHVPPLPTGHPRTHSFTLAHAHAHTGVGAAAFRAPVIGSPLVSHLRWSVCGRAGTGQRHTGARTAQRLGRMLSCSTSTASARRTSR